MDYYRSFHRRLSILRFAFMLTCVKSVNLHVNFSICSLPLNKCVYLVHEHTIYANFFHGCNVTESFSHFVSLGLYS